MIAHDAWPCVQAKWYRKIDGIRAIRLIVIHTMEVSEQVGAARRCADDFATRAEDEKASAHVCVDDLDAISCVDSNDVAFCAPGTNNDGLHVELAGSFRQTREQWGDAYSIDVLANGANVVAQLCLAYDIPPRQLSDAELLAGEHGIIGHVQSARVYRKERVPEEHQDPGAGFPWQGFMLEVIAQAGVRRAQFKSATW